LFLRLQVLLTLVLTAQSNTKLDSHATDIVLNLQEVSVALSEAFLVA